MRRRIVLWISLLSPALLPLFLSCSSLPAPREADERNGIRHFDKGWVEYAGGVPIIHLRGTPREAGLQYGVLMKRELHAAYGAFEEYADEVAADIRREVPWILRPLVGPYFALEKRRMADRYFENLPESYREELRGMAEGSGLPLRKVTFPCAALERLFTGCTSLLLRDGDRIVHGRNLDWDAGFAARFPAIVDCRIDGAYRTVSATFVGVPHMFTAVNEHGLSFTIDLAMGLADDSENGRSFLEFGDLLRTCRNLDEVERLLEGRRLPGAWIVVFGSLEDRSGAVFDYNPHQVVRNDLEDRAMAIGNLYRSPEMRRAWARIWAANDYNCLRRARYAEWERGTGDPVDRAIGLLADTVHPDHAGERSPSTFSTVNNPTTFQSAVIDAANHALYVAVHPHYAAWSRWIRFDYRTLSVSVHRSADPRLRDETFLAYAGLIHRAMETGWNDREGQKKLEKALLESETQNLFTCQYLVRSRIARGDWERADAAAERTAALYPRDDYAHFYLGNRAREAGRLTEAVEHYRRAEAGRVSCDMDRFLILLRSAFCLDDLGRKEEARDAASRALAVARCYASGGGEEYEKAVARLERLAGEKR